MSEITGLFWDVGGVILTNGWDHASREKAVAQFHLDSEDYRDRHELTFPALETGQMTLDEYLQRTIFYRSRPFTREQFKEFMFAQSREYPETRAVLRALARSGKYRLATINNELLELNQYRIERFNLREDFSAFFSSCYLGVRKPDERIYRIALQVTQCDPKRSVFIDDRPPNVEGAQKTAMNTIHYQNVQQLRAALSRHGVETVV